jgi:hypothetical protein
VYVPVAPAIQSNTTISGYILQWYWRDNAPALSVALLQHLFYVFATDLHANSEIGPVNQLATDVEQHVSAHLLLHLTILLAQSVKFCQPTTQQVLSHKTHGMNQVAFFRAWFRHSTDDPI